MTDTLTWLKELLEAIAAHHTEEWHIEHGYDRYVTAGLYAPECDTCLKAEAAEEELAKVPRRLIVQELVASQEAFTQQLLLQEDRRLNDTQVAAGMAVMAEAALRLEKLVMEEK